MRSVPKIDIPNARLLPMVESDPMITSREAKATMVDATGVSGSQQDAHAVLETLGYTRKNRVQVHAPLFSTDIAPRAFLARRDRYEAPECRLVFPVGETCFGRNDPNIKACSRRGAPVICMIELEENDDAIVLSRCSGLAFGGLRFASREGSYKSMNHFVESLKTFLLTPGDVVLFDNVFVYRSRCDRAFADSIAVALLFIPPYAASFSLIDAVSCTVKRNHRFAERIADAFRTRSHPSACRVSRASRSCSGEFLT